MTDKPKQASFFIQDPFTEEVHGPMSVQDLKQWYAKGAVAGWTVSKSPNGPWTPVEAVKGLAPSKAVAPSSGNLAQTADRQAESVSGSHTLALSQRTTTPAALKPTTASPTTDAEGHVEVHQLDTTTFLVEGLSFDSVFSKLRHAATKQHQVVGAFPKSGTIRGQGRSGITFVISVAQQNDAVQFVVDGQTPQGPANFGVLFNPMSAQGWATAGAAALFNSVVNSKAASSVEGDVTMLMLNLLDAFGAETLLLGTGEGSVRVSRSDDDMSNVTVELVGTDSLRTNFPRQRLPGLAFRVLQTAALSQTSDVLQAFGLKGTARFDRLSEIAIDTANERVTGRSLPRGGAAIPMYFHFVVSVSDGGPNNTLLRVETTAPAHEPAEWAVKQSNAIRDVIAVELGAKITGEQIDAGAVISQSNEKAVEVVQKSTLRKVAWYTIGAGCLGWILSVIPAVPLQIRDLLETLSLPAVVAAGPLLLLFSLFSRDKQPTAE